MNAFRVMWASLLTGAAVALIATALWGLAEATAVLMPIASILLLLGMAGAAIILLERGSW